MIKDGNRPPHNHHHHNDPHGKEGNAYELLPDRRLPCIAPPRASTRKLEVAKNETVYEWWQVRLRWCGDDHLDSSWMVGDGRFFYYHGDVFNKIDPDIDMWQKRWFCQSFDKRTIVPQRKIAPDKELHLCRTIRPTVGTLRPHSCPQCLQLCTFSMWNLYKIKTIWAPKDKPVNACFLYSRLDPVGSVQWFITMVKLWTGSV